MAIAFVQQVLDAATVASTARTLAFGSAHTAGNLLTAITAFQSSGSISTVTDTVGNVWTLAFAKRNNPGVNAGSNIEFWYAPNIGSGTNTVTIKYGGSTQASAWESGVHEWSGAKTASVVGNSSGLSIGTASSVFTTGNLASPQANSLVIAAWRPFGAYTNRSEPSGYSTLAPNQQSRSNAGYKILGAAPGAEDPTWTLQGTSSGIGAIIEFLAAPSAGQSPSFTLMGIQ